MLLLLLKTLTSLGWKIPTAFSYSSTRMMLAALTSLLVTILLGPRFIKRLYELKTGQSIRVEDCPMLAELHEKKKKHPYDGRHSDAVFHDGGASSLDGSFQQLYVDIFYDHCLAGLYWRV